LAETFDFFPLRFYFTANQDLRFPPGKVGNILRGALGKNFKKLACTPDCGDSRTCARRGDCAYARWFEPSSPEGPSGFRDQPRPFVLRASHLDGVSVGRGEPFCIGLNVFDPRAVEDLSRAMAEFASLQSIAGRELLQLPLDSHEAVQVRVRFLTPTELKGGDAPEFAVLFARIRDRVSTLRALYGDGPLTIDFKAMAERAARIRMTRSELTQVTAERVSRRTGQRHPLGGFTGFAEYEGDLGEFIPYLEAARHTGVGRQTVWGKGEIGIETF
jgi:hypothetical protein